MNRSARKAAGMIRNRRRAGQLAKTFGHRPRSLATYALAASDMNRPTAEGCANSLRSVAKKLGIEGTRSIATRTIQGGGRKRTEVPTTQYTPAQVRQIAERYAPRNPAYKRTRARLLALTAA
ncbi:hypothetical protein OG871_40690 (plasmid) [Kitasatospora sp. NBC_00374]|uniref:hypothetical protein n=1 Tax=Kitasatospora sp. NBC_00374 TaxID=2975964 RepID=UPI002F91838B